MREIEILNHSLTFSDYDNGRGVSARIRYVVLGSFECFVSIMLIMVKGVLLCEMPFKKLDQYFSAYKIAFFHVWKDTRWQRNHTVTNDQLESQLSNVNQFLERRLRELELNFQQTQVFGDLKRHVTTELNMVKKQINVKNASLEVVLKGKLALLEAVFNGKITSLMRTINDRFSSVQTSLSRR